MHDRETRKIVVEMKICMGRKKKKKLFPLQHALNVCSFEPLLLKLAYCKHRKEVTGK